MAELCLLVMPDSQLKLQVPEVFQSEEQKVIVLCLFICLQCGWEPGPSPADCLQHIFKMFRIQWSFLWPTTGREGDI